MITNARIERKKNEIARTEENLLEVRAKLRTKKQELRSLEDAEIVAMFRSNTINEDDLAALMRSRQEAENDDEDYLLNVQASESHKRREENSNAISEK